jgi:hypothetical protein
MFDAFVHLSGCAKYIARGSPWEVLESLHRARTELWRLWAAAQRVPDPQYGLTAVLDSPPTPLPDDIDKTVASLDREQLLRAAITCCELLLRVWPSAISAVSDRALPAPTVAGEVRRQLRPRRPPECGHGRRSGTGDSCGARD